MEAKALVRYFYEVVVSEHQLEKLPDFVDAQCIWISGTESKSLGVEGMHAHLMAVRQTYPEYTMKISQQYQDGDVIVSIFTMTARHDGEWLGMAPSHKQLIFQGINVDTVKNGRIVAHGGAVNTFETLWEAGVLSPAEKG